mgnify:CR=1 FL=1
MEIIVLIAFGALFWLVWQLYKAKKFTQFKQNIEQNLKAKVIMAIKEELAETRSEQYPNNACHEQATIFYWTQYKSRILHAALEREIITKEWLEKSGNIRNAQHLFHVEQQFLP